MPDQHLSDLSDHWTMLEPTEADEYRTELQRECPAGHALHGVDVEPLAVRRLRKELVVWAPQRRVWVWVHLTWAVETDPRWPTTQHFDSWDGLVAALREADRG